MLIQLASALIRELGVGLAVSEKAFQKMGVFRRMAGLSLLQNLLPFTGYPYEGAIIDCPVCGASNHKQIARFDRRLKRLSTHMCFTCGLFFTNPMPSSAELDRFYAATYRAEYQFAFLRPRKTHQIRKQREADSRSSRISEIIGFNEPVRFLDFGCGSGELVRAMAVRGYEAHGFEPGVDYGSFGQDKLAEDAGGANAIRVGSWRDMDYPANSFDAISCLHVLEHLNDPMAALEKIHDWLADGGVLYLETPNMQNYVLKGFDCFHFAHVLGFSRDNLLFALEKSGFQMLREDRPTSFLLVKKGDPRGAALVYDLAGAVKKNHSEFTAGITLFSYLKRHSRRIKKVAKEEIRASQS